MTRRIVFIEARSPRPHIFSKALLPRLGAVLLGTMARDAGWDVEVFVEDVAEVDWTVALEADVAAVSTITSTAPRAYAIADRFRDAGIPVVMGGAHPTFCAEETLQHADYVVRGEGEAALLPLINAMAARRDPGDLPGLSRRDATGIVRHSPLAPFLQDLDSTPIPDYSLIRGSLPKRRVTSIATSRGCPYDCEFCSVIEMFGRRYRFHSEDRVLAEIRRNGIGSGHVFICDDNFCAKPRRTKNILQRVAAEGLHFNWSAQVRVEAARDTELLELMAATGCYAVYVGFESVNEKTLVALNKHQTVKDIRQAITRFHDHGIHVHGMFVLGSDEDDVETIQETARFSRTMRIDSTQFLILTPLPGTRTFKTLEREGRLLTRDWELYDGANVVFEPRKMTPYELQREALRAHKKFYTLASAIRLAVKRDWNYAAIRYYAHRQTIKTTRAVAEYTEHLRQLAVEKLGLGGNVEKIKRKIKSLGIVANWLDPKSQMVLTTFLNNLGVRTVLAPEAAAPPPPPPAAPNNMSNGDKLAGDRRLAQQQAIAERRITDAMAALRERADAILVPINATLRQQLDVLNHRGESLRQWLCENTGCQGRLCLTPEIESTELYKTCVQIGLAMGMRLGKIRRAYLEAMQSLESLTTAKGTN